ncbi:MAG TPA: hypothetical protein VMT16_04395 [Thermoanaerobaculia bacterium]|nr:hypothetical protein [Thermoanaerobaculia bacterium]
MPRGVRLAYLACAFALCLGLAATAGAQTCTDPYPPDAPISEGHPMGMSPLTFCGDNEDTATAGSCGTSARDVVFEVIITQPFNTLHCVLDSDGQPLDNPVYLLGTDCQTCLTGNQAGELVAPENLAPGTYFIVVEDPGDELCKGWFSVDCSLTVWPVELLDFQLEDEPSEP